MKISRLFLVALMLMIFADFALAKKAKSTKDSAQVVESTESKGESDKEQTSTLWSVSADEKSGGFFGFEVGLGGATMQVTIVGKKNIPTIYPNIIFGYQWYFLDVPWAHLGLRFSGHIGYAFYWEDEFAYLDTINPRWVYDTSQPVVLKNGLKWSVLAHGVQYGADLGFMWDFVDSSNHTLGIYISPLGFEGSTLWGVYQTEMVNPAYSWDTNIALQNVLDTLTSHTKFAYTLNAGLQYMYRHHHLLLLSYRMRLYSDKLSKFEPYDYVEYGGTIQPRKARYGFSVQPKHNFVFSYAYKF